MADGGRFAAPCSSAANANPVVANAPAATTARSARLRPCFERRLLSSSPAIRLTNMRGIRDPDPRRSNLQLRASNLLARAPWLARATLSPASWASPPVADLPFAGNIYLTPRYILLFPALRARCSCGLDARSRFQRGRLCSPDVLRPSTNRLISAVDAKCAARADSPWQLINAGRV